MVEPIITSEERQQLIKLYQEDKLNAPPANIKDETLIKNYGTDEQKARLQQPPAAEAQKAAENKTNTGEKEDPATKELNHQRELYKELHGEAPDDSLKVDELTALNLTKKEEVGGAKPEQPNTSQAPALPSAEENKEYINEFGKYVDLHLRMPDSNLTLAELQKANATRVLQLQQEAAEAEQIRANMKSGRGVGGQTVELIHRDTKEKIIMPAYTYDNFMKKQMPEWSPAPELPAELDVKPPVESIGK